MTTQNTPKFTTGPWEAYESNGFQQRPIWDIYDSDGFTICEIPNNKSAAKVHECDEIEANARLIAAAPEMYEALSASLRMIDELTAQASTCLSHVGVMERQQDWVRNEIRAYAKHLRGPIDAAISKAVQS